MKGERVKIYIRRIFWTIIFIIFAVLPTVVIIKDWIGAKRAEIVYNECYVDDYSVDIIVTFDREIFGDVYLDVSFYDVDGGVVKREMLCGWGTGDSATCSTFLGEMADSYEIHGYEVYVGLDTILSGAIVVLLIAALPIAFFINAMTLSCKIYYYRGREILVYAGYYHHYIKVNGEKYDQHDELINWSFLYLSCILEDDTWIEVTINKWNRVFLKVDGHLILPNVNYQ